LKFLENYFEVKIGPKLSFGVVYYLENFIIGSTNRLDDRMVFAFDLNDLMNPDKSFVNAALKKLYINSFRLLQERY
jgi:hypothetical protein